VNLTGQWSTAIAQIPLAPFNTGHPKPIYKNKKDFFIYEE
jgi:hypothetical protein